ncbi:MAG: SPOR domain-containing protein [Lautropia sp.]|nr:MAG: SPOR domain-containing protein [Lautropia sp.]
MSRPKSRNGSDSAADASLAEKKKARHRLVGAIALCLVAAFVVPMLLESEPRTGLRSLPMTVEAAANSTRADQPWIRPPVADEAARSVMPDQVVMLEEGAAGQPATSGQGAPRAPGDQPSVNLPDLSARTGQDPETPATPAVPPSSPQPARSAASDTAAGRGRAAAGQDAANQARPARPATAPSGNTSQRPANAPLPKPLPMTQGGAQSDADSRPDVLARLIDQVDSGSNAARPTARQQSRRFLVQVGAYSNVKSARAAVDRVAKAGLNAYQETVKTSNGDWIRVRVGPFASREDAEQAQQALKRAGVTAALIAL